MNKILTLAIQSIGLPEGLTAAADGAFRAVLCIEGQLASEGDRREIEPGALTWRELPMPITWAPATGDDHEGRVVGTIDTVERVGNEIIATGRFDLGSEEGVEANRLVTEQIERWVSIDLEVFTEEWIEEGDCTPDEIGMLGEDCVMTNRVIEGRIMGAALVGFSAFPGAVIVPADAEIPEATEDGRPAADMPMPEEMPMPVMAHAATFKPPVDWFTEPEPVEGDPRLVLQRNGSYAVPFTVLESGQVYGHLAPEDTCHIGYGNRCLTIDEVGADMAFFHRGAVLAAGCDCEIPTGVITAGAGHENDMSADWRATVAHYDDNGYGAADVTAVRGTYGIWLAGALRPGVTPEQVYRLRASGVSGDWRPVGGKLELIGAVSVNTAGFPISRARVASGKVVSMIAGAIPQPDTAAPDPLAAVTARLDALEARLTFAETVAGEFASDAAERIRVRIVGD